MNLKSIRNRSGINQGPIRDRFGIKIHEYIFPVFWKSRVFARNGSRTKMARSYHRQISWNCVPRLFRYIKDRKTNPQKMNNGKFGQNRFKIDVNRFNMELEILPNKFQYFKKPIVFARHGSRTKMARSYRRQISWNCVPRLFRYIKNQKIENQKSKK